MSQQTPTQLTLVMRQGPQPDQGFPLHKDILTIGRAADNDIVIDEGEVSRNHARLTRQGDVWIMEDLNSRNGTFVGGQRITGPVVLTPDSRVSLGPNVLLEMGAGPAAPAPVPAQPPAQPASQVASTATTAAATARGGGSAVLFLLAGVVGVVVLAAVAAGLAYVYLRSPEPSVAAALPAGVGPDIAFQDPAPGTRVSLGGSVLVFATARDEDKVTRVDLWVDDELVVQQDSPDPDGVTPLSLIHSLVSTAPGTYALRVRAYNSLGGMGESPTLYVTVSEEPEPATAQYVIQPGDTQETITKIMSTTVAAIQKENPGMGKVSAPGQVIVVPVVAEPRSLPLPQDGLALPPAQRGAQPDGSGREGAAGGPAPGGPKVGEPQSLALTPGGAGAEQAKFSGLVPAGADRSAPGRNQFPPKGVKADPPKGSSAIPLLEAKAGDCTVDLSWNAVPNATNYVISSQISPSSKWTLVKTLKADQRTYEDKDLKPGTYFYQVGANKAGSQPVVSNPKEVVVSPSDKCIPRGDYKLVHFQPLNFDPTDSKYTEGALFVTVGGVTGRKIPSSQGKGHPAGDWSSAKEEVWPAPMSVYLNPDEPLRLEVTGSGREGSDKKPEELGSFEKAHSGSEMGAKKEITGGNDQFKLTYRLRFEDTKWTGKGTADSIKPPPKLRLAETAQDVRDKLLSKEIYSCNQGCDPGSSRILLWDFAGDEKAIEGYVLYRGYSCPGQEGQIKAPQVLGKQYQAINIPATSEPAGCVARYQVSAFGPAGESAPSNELILQPTSTVSRVKVTFVDLTLRTQTNSEIYLQANEYKRWSKKMIIPSGTSVLSGLYFDDMKGNNVLTVNLGKGEDLLVSLQAGSCKLGPKSVDSTKSGTYTLKQGDPEECSATVVVDSLGEVSPGQVARPQADVGIVHPYLVGKDVYVRLDSLGPDTLSANQVELTSYWLTPGTQDKPLTAKKTITRWWPAFSDSMEVKVGNISDIGQQDPKKVPLYVKVTPLDFDDPYGNNNVWHEEIPEFVALIGGVPFSGSGAPGVGDLCSTAAECKEGLLCADNKRCAPAKSAKGAGSEGDYCHSDEHCASGVCLCADGLDEKFCSEDDEACYWGYTSGKCANWDNEEIGGMIGTCIEASQYGAPCSGNDDCASGHCAGTYRGGKKCAPADDSGKAGEYCHHDNQCKSGKCQCGWRSGNDAHCPFHPGTCASQQENGTDCDQDDNCKSGYCSDHGRPYGKCAPKPGTGQPGDYCHHQEHCGVGFCECRDVAGSDGDFCKDWPDFNPTRHAKCTVPDENGSLCEEDKECASGYCSDKLLFGRLGKCAPKNGTAQTGEYCHHGDHCASGLCVCPDDHYVSGFCKELEYFTREYHGECAGKYANGIPCSKNEHCESGHCADGDRCAPKNGEGKAADYCHHDDHCESGTCHCPEGWDGKFCKDFHNLWGNDMGSCSLAPVKKVNGKACSKDEQCQSGQCADAWPWQKGKCTPKDGTGQSGDYCHHTNHCTSGLYCLCPDLDYDGSFCKKWKRFTPTYRGTCSVAPEKKSNGDWCSKSEECTSGHCADGAKCAPKDKTGESGDYCHHNNHCRSKKCDCSKGTDWFGFCKDWRKGETGTCY